MLEWKIGNEDEKLKNEIQRCQDTFDSWFYSYWSHNCTRERMLSDSSPLQHVYYKMCKSFEEVKEKFPVKECCSSCGELMGEWIETEFSFCNEYGCGMKLCKKCAEKLRNSINSWL